MNDEDLFNNDKYLEDYEEEIDVEENRLDNRITQVKESISQYELRLKGYEWTGNGKKLRKKGDSSAGNNFINKIMVLLFIGKLN